MSCRSEGNEECFIKDVGRPQGDRPSECAMVYMRLVCSQRPHSIRRVSDRSNTVDVVWYHTRNMDVCWRFSVLPLPCVSVGLTMGRSAFQEVL
jgi:hypothetical protein